MDLTCPRCESELQSDTCKGGYCPDCKLEYWWDTGYVPGTDLDYYIVQWEEYGS